MVFYQGEASYVYNCALHKVMVDCDIKAFAKESLNMN
jgi:hypothetical protein